MGDLGLDRHESDEAPASKPAGEGADTFEARIAGLDLAGLRALRASLKQALTAAQAARAQMRNARVAPDILDQQSDPTKIRGEIIRVGRKILELGGDLDI